MENGNYSTVSEFILLGLSSHLEKQKLIFVLFLIMYLIGAAGNLLIILAIGSDSHLHTPMYFFLSNLSLVDFCFTSATVPKMLLNIHMQILSISREGCLTQIYFCILLANMDNFLLTTMTYDRYVAICYPLQYTTMMSLWLCCLMLVGSWPIANLHSLLHTLLMVRLNFRAKNVMPYFYDLFPLLQLSCSDTSLNRLMILLIDGLIVLIPFLCILISYTPTLTLFWWSLRFHLPRGKQKAFSTCGSHLTVVILFYGTITGIYLNPSSFHSAEKDSVASVMYMVVTPMLNPFIYCLRNNEMKRALRKVFSRQIFHRL